MPSPKRKINAKSKRGYGAHHPAAALQNTVRVRFNGKWNALFVFRRQCRKIVSVKRSP
ncbi:MAG: hypothetical protein M3525_15240 [Acidobacteriota bacterium]|nr:hypothetical protein [Acidobacteriota bacterium]